MLCIAEKHSVAKKIAEILAESDVKQNKINKFTFVYTFTTHINNQKIQCMVAHGAGHATEYGFTNKTNNPQDFFTLPIEPKISEYGTGLKHSMSKYAIQANQIVLCQDNDREGEHIAWECVEIISCIRPINIYPAQLPNVRKQNQHNIISSQNAQAIKASRCRFNSLTKAELLQALQNLTQLDMNTIEAVDVRLQLDLRIGFALSCYQNKNSHILNKIDESVQRQKKPPNYTFGTCQIPTLGLCITRKPKNFSQDSNIQAETVDLTLCSKTMPHLECCEESIKCNYQLKLNPNIEIHGNASTIVSHPPPPPNTIDLQKSLSSHPAHQIMKIAETLYQKGLISYPRTETQVFTQQMDIPKTLQILQETEYKNYILKLSQNQQFAENFKAIKQRQNSRQLHNDESHPPIHPLKAAALDGMEKVVYDMVARKFLASISFDCVKVQHEYTTQIGSTELKCSKTFVKDPGWMEILLNQQAEQIPDLAAKLIKEVQTLKIHKVEHTPEQMNQKLLIERMDAYGVGTDATIAEHIQNVQDRGYVDNKLITQQAGNIISVLYQNVNVHFLATSFRAMMEAGLREICAGKRRAEDFYAEIIGFARQLFDDVRRYFAAVK